jgi:DNA primase
MIDQHQIDEILEKNNIVDVINSYIPLKKSGSNYKARCPFHDEKTASFTVSERKQIFKCFGCGKGGNVIHFVQEYEKLSFFEALKKMAVRAGIVLQTSAIQTKKQNRKDLIYQIYKLAGAFFEDNLFERGDYALKYLSERKFSNDTIRKFHLGYSLNSYNALRNNLIKNDINEKILASTGLFTSNGNDLFRDRLMFPIHDRAGKIVAFGGRIMHEDNSVGKYVNSPTTEIYTKGNELYGLFLTKNIIHEKKSALICEGYTDFLRLYENGYRNIVASLGTSLTEGQIKLLSHFTENFYLIYDGDKAGIKAAVRAAVEVMKQSLNAFIIVLPDEADPDNYLQENSVEDLNKLIFKARTLPEFLFEDELLELDKKGKLDILLNGLRDLDDEISKELQIKQIGEIFGISERAIHNQIKSNWKKKPEIIEKKLDFFEDEKNLLCLILDDKLLYKNVAQEIDSTYFFSDAYRSIYKIVQEYIEEMGQISMLIDKAVDEQQKKIISELLIADVPNVAAKDLINNLKLRKYKHELKTIDARIRNNQDPNKLYKKKIELKKKIRQLDKKIVSKTLY